MGCASSSGTNVSQPAKKEDFSNINPASQNKTGTQSQGQDKQQSPIKANTINTKNAADKQNKSATGNNNEEAESEFDDEEGMEEDEEYDDEIEEGSMRQSIGQKSQKSNKAKNNQQAAANTFLGESQKSSVHKKPTEKLLEKTPTIVSNQNQEPRILSKDERELQAKREEMKDNISQMKKQLTLEDNKKSSNIQANDSVMNRFKESTESNQQHSIFDNDDPATKELNNAIESYKEEMKKMKESIKEMERMNSIDEEAKIGQGTASAGFHKDLQFLSMNGLEVQKVISQQETQQQLEFQNDLIHKKTETGASMQIQSPLERRQVDQQSFVLQQSSIKGSYIEQELPTKQETFKQQNTIKQINNQLEVPIQKEATLTIQPKRLTMEDHQIKQTSLPTSQNEYINNQIHQVLNNAATPTSDYESPSGVIYQPKQPSQYQGFQQAYQQQKPQIQQKQQNQNQIIHQEFSRPPINHDFKIGGTSIESPGRDQEPDDDKQPKYYNFDEAVISSNHLLGKNYQVQSNYQKAQQQSLVNDEEPTRRGVKNLYKDLQTDKLTQEQLAQLKEEFQDQEERERLNPQNILLRVMFIHSFQKDQNDKEMQLERKLFSFFVHKNSNIIELKEKIKREFGFDYAQQRLYFKYKDLKDTLYIMDIPDFDIEEDILICITIDPPMTHYKLILRDPLEDIKISDVRFLNSNDRGKDNSKQDHQYNIDVNKFDVDSERLHWPIYRDWTFEAAQLNEIIVKNKQILFSDDRAFQMQDGTFIQSLHSSPELVELIEAESQMRKLQDEFKRASLYAVHLVVKKNPTPLNLFNIYGDDGDKFIVGGIFIRRAKGWTICGQTFNDFQNMQSSIVGISPNNDQNSAVNLTEISGKIASLDVRNMALLRNKIENLIVPLACIVDYYGLKFETQSLVPLSINSLIYGSDTDGLLYTDEFMEGQIVAQKISQMLNLKAHFIEEKATKKIKKVFLPYTVQLHRNKELQNDGKIYLINPYRIFPQDESLRQNKQQNIPMYEIMSKQLRPELVLSNNRGEAAEGYKLFTWKTPTKCDECGEYINDYEYFYFEKRSVDKAQRIIIQYYCCIQCYTELLPTEGFKYPINKIVRKELAIKERSQYWMNLATGKKQRQIPYKKIQLNSDAFMNTANTKDKSEKESDQEEVYRAGQKLKDEIIEKFIDDLNNVEEDPLNSQQLEELMHLRGIGMRHLGKICTNVTYLMFNASIQSQLNHIREIAVIEVVARSTKLLIRDGLTFLADDEEAGFKGDNIKKCVLHYLQEIFNMDEFKQVSTQNIWDFITEHARKKFQITVEKDVLSKVHLSTLLLSICEKLNIKLSKSIKDIDFYAVDQDGLNNFLALQDIEFISPVVKDYQDKTMPLVSEYDIFPSSLTLILESARLKDGQGKRSQWYMVGGTERQESTELYRLACSVCEQIYTPNSIFYAKILKELGEQLESRHQERGRPENSRWNKSFAIPDDEMSMESRYFLQNSLQILQDLGQEDSILAAEIFTSLARLFKPRSTQFQNYRERDVTINDMFQNLNNAIAIYETCLGFDHPETGDAYAKMALAYQESGNFMAASPWIRRAFSIFYKTFGPHDEITQNTYEYLKVIEINIDSKLDQVPFDDLPNAIIELEKQQKFINEKMQMMNAAPYSIQ